MYLTVSAYLSLLLITFCMCAPASYADSESSNRLAREEIMVLNLKHKNDSTGMYLLQSIKQSKAMENDLSKALHQLQQVDKSYAKSIGHADDTYFSAPTKDLNDAVEMTKQLQAKLDQAKENLYAAVQETLIMHQERMKQKHGQRKK